MSTNFFPIIRYKYEVKWWFIKIQKIITAKVPNSLTFELALPEFTY